MYKNYLPGVTIQQCITCSDAEYNMFVDNMT